MKRKKLQGLCHTLCDGVLICMQAAQELRWLSMILISVEIWSGGRVCIWALVLHISIYTNERELLPPSIMLGCL